MLGPLKYDIWAVASTSVHTNGQQTVTIAWRWRVSCDICNIMAISGCAVCVSMKRLYSYWWSRTSPKCPYAKVLIKPVEKRLHESMTQTKAANCKYNNNRAYIWSTITRTEDKNTSKLACAWWVLRKTPIVTGNIVILSQLTISVWCSDSYMCFIKGMPCISADEFD